MPVKQEKQTFAVVLMFLRSVGEEIELFNELGLEVGIVDHVSLHVSSSKIRKICLIYSNIVRPFLTSFFCS